ncbi:MAG: class II fructose-bisphosphate aldolase [Patescibacteria group bacterium]
MKMNAAKELRLARRGGYAIGAFNTSNLEITKAICAAARELKQPILIQTTPSAIKYAGLKTLFDIVRDEVENSGIKAAIHLDHGKEWEIAKACLDIGYKSVMIDGSCLPYSENVALTRRVVKYAHWRGAAVEGEIGVLGAKEIDEAGRDRQDVLSSPERTTEFIKKTGVDSIAVAIGNEHGAPQDEEIDLKLLAKIASIVKIPLVIHGSSGLSDDQIKAAIKSGVGKFNVDTRIRKAYLAGIYGASREEKDYRTLFEAAMPAVTQVVKNRIQLFSNR